MPKPTAEIDIVNLALLQLHEGGISSLNDPNSATAKAALQLAATCRRARLRNNLWNFAKKRDTIPLVAGKTPKFDYDSYYQLPNDFLRLRGIGPEEDEEAGIIIRHDIEGRYLLLDGTEASVEVRYTRDEEDISLWDALAVQVLYLDVAIELCIPITNDEGKQAKLIERRDAVLIEALAVDHQERPVRVIDVDEIAAARALTADPWPRLDWSEVDS